jgi:type I restriction enzyme, S subunit
MNVKNTSWPEVRIGQILSYTEELVKLDDLKEYVTITVKRRHGGLEPRERLFGHQIKTKKQYRLIPGAFLISRIQCWHQAYAIVPEDIPGNMIASQNYDQFIISTDVDPRFFWWFSPSPLFTETVRSSAFGVVIEKMVFNRDAWLEKTIPLPPLTEQRRIVSRIEQLVVRVEEARRLQKEVAKEMDSLCRALIMNPPDGPVTPTAMRDLVKLRHLDVVVEPTSTYHFAGVYCFGRGVFSGQQKRGSEFSYRALTRLRKGDFVYPKLMAWEGALGTVPDTCDGLYVSPEFPVFEVLEDRVLPEVLDTFFRTPRVWPELAAISTGTNVRRRRLHPTAFLRYEIPLPSMSVQRQLRSIKQRVEQSKDLQSKTAAELDALVPSILSKAFRGEL